MSSGERTEILDSCGLELSVFSVLNKLVNVSNICFYFYTGIFQRDSAKMARYMIFVHLLLALILLVLAGILVWYISEFGKLKKQEGFMNLVTLSNNIENECPLSAERQSDGRILVQPQNKSFDSMQDYVAWLQSVFAAGSMCVPPYVRGAREVIVTSDRDIGPNQNQLKLEDRSGAIFTNQVPGEMTYAKTPINKLDDYEYTRVFTNENGPRGDLSRTAVNSLIAKHQLDWAKLPFNSEDRASAENEFVAGRMDNAFRDPKSGVFFRAVEGFEQQPPDLDAKETAEKAALEPFKSHEAVHLIEHNVDDVADMVKKMYDDDPEWEPVIEKIGDNEFRVSELRPRLKKEQFEDDAPKTIEKAKDEGTISAAVTVEGGNKDPYFDKNGVIDYGNNRYWEYTDFKKWTPGLERMFAPTLDQNNWV